VFGQAESAKTPQFFLPRKIVKGLPTEWQPL
jgi:hypothetical protein